MVVTPSLLYMCCVVTLPLTAHSACVFGSGDCFYPCRCHFSQCTSSDRACRDCDVLSGECTLEQDTCQYDEFTSDLYPTRYWTGPACQKGNIAQGKLYSIEGLFEFKPANGGATDGTFTFAVSAFISPFSHVIIVHLEGNHAVELIDLFVEFERSLEELSTYVEVTLEARSGRILPCSFHPNKTQVQQTNNNNNTVDGARRMRFECEAPSTGEHLKVKTLETGGINIPVTVYEVVMIGYKYADIDLGRCVQFAGDEEIEWCTQCNNSLPPDCRESCEEDYYGVNCQNSE